MPDDIASAPLKGAALIKDEVKRLPDKPGVYRMMGDDGEVLYVGKARSLKKRVIQYAQGRFHTNRIAHMVDLTRSMEFVTTKTETDALRVRLHCGRGALERGKDHRQLGGRDADAAVGDLDDDRIGRTLPARLYRHRRAAAVFHRVFDQVA